MDTKIIAQMPEKSSIFQLTLFRVQFVVLRDAQLCVFERRKVKHLFVINFQRIDRPFFAQPCVSDIKIQYCPHSDKTLIQNHHI
jgi:hypothetical protein